MESRGNWAPLSPSLSPWLSHSFSLVPSLPHFLSQPAASPISCISCIVNSSQQHDKVSARVPPHPTPLLPTPPPCSCSYLLLSSCYRVFVFIPLCFLLFFSGKEKEKLIKYGTRRSSISLNHHVIKMASLGDGLKRSQRTMSSQSDIYGPRYVNTFPLFSMYISCNYHFL